MFEQRTFAAYTYNPAQEICQSEECHEQLANTSAPGLEDPCLFHSYLFVTSVARCIEFSRLGEITVGNS